jgi:hypothetical protein
MVKAAVETAPARNRRRDSGLLPSVSVDMNVPPWKRAGR